MTRQRSMLPPAVPYEVGYGRPPVTSRFQKGRSGNPHGRPKGTTGVRQVLDEALDETIGLADAAGERRITKRRAILMSMIARAIKGDVRAAAMILGLVDCGDRGSTVPRVRPEDLSDEELVEIILAGSRPKPRGGSASSRQDVVRNVVDDSQPGTDLTVTPRSSR